MERQVFGSQVVSCPDFIPIAMGDTGEIKVGNDTITFVVKKVQSGGSKENVLFRKGVG